ncbi:MAG: CARDB domain-containing protein [Anaerolineae bacterium]
MAQINDEGGVEGADGTRFRLELVVQSVETQGLEQAVTNLLQASVIAVLGPNSLNNLPEDLALLQTLNVPVLTPNLDDTLLLSDRSGLIFRSRAAQVFQGRALADYLHTDLGSASVATIQLDIESTAANVGFTTAAQALGIAVNPAMLLQGGDTIEILAADLLQANPPAAVAYGVPEQVAELYNAVRAAGWNGIFAYEHADDAAFRELVPLERLAGVLATTTWAFTSQDPVSDAFLNDFVRAFGEVPAELEAAGYDSINLLAAAIHLPGELAANLPALGALAGVQGVLNPSQLARGELSNNVAVVQLGAFGAPQVLVRYAGGTRLTGDVPVVVNNTPVPNAPTATATPQGVVLTITNAIQNVRSGPGLQYDVIGQLNQGDQVPVIGASVDYSWVVIDFRGRQGWLATYLLDVFGDLNTVAIIQPPPTPTPLPFTATPLAPQEPDIVIVSATPNTITVGIPFNIQVTVRNQGLTNAGPFAVAASFPPDNLYSAVNLSGLAAQQQTVVSLTGTLTGGTGRQTALIIADLNNQVAEGAAGEANNNTYSFGYMVDRPLLTTGSVTLTPGGTADVENNGSAQDVRWNATGTALEVAGANFIVLIPNTTYDNIHYDALSPAIINQTSIPVGSLFAGAVVGVITTDGRRGAIRIDSGVASGGSITFTYRVYQ